MKPIISFILTSYRNPQLVINTVSDLVSLSKDYHTEILVASTTIIDFESQNPVRNESRMTDAATQALEDLGYASNIVDFAKDCRGSACHDAFAGSTGDIYQEDVTVLPKIDFKNVTLRQFLNKDCSGEGLGIFPESSVRCFNFLANQAAADFVVVAVDDHMVTGDLTSLLKNLTVENGTLSPFYNKKYKIGTLKGYPGSTPTCPGTRQYYEEERAYRESYICCWPIFHKSVLDEFGGVLFNQSFYHHFCDNWISYWLFKQGEPIPIIHDLQMHGRAKLVNKNNPGYDDVMFRTLVEYHDRGTLDYNVHITKPVELTVMPKSFGTAGALVKSPFSK
jgi:hypothetical protein